MTDLLDARGYEITLRTSSKEPVVIRYLGPFEREHRELTYEEDPYVVSCVENQTFKQSVQIALKDPGIRKSGLRICLEAEEQTEVTVCICGEKTEQLLAGPGGMESHMTGLSGLCSREKDYLEQVHQILYKLLAEVDRICKKHDLKYFLVFGGLLGVLRCGDIIPWDDDVDIAMTRTDFQRFQQVAPGELSEEFCYLDCSALGDGFLDFLCRVLYVKEEVPVNVFRKVSGVCKAGIENHLPLDIYILDRAADQAWKHRFQILLVRIVYGLGMGHRAYLKKADYRIFDRTTRMGVYVLAAIGRRLPLSFIYRLHDWVSTMNQKRETADYFLSNGYVPFIHTRYSREWFETSTEVTLGEITCSAPGDIQAFLKRAYYDYVHYPPLSKRVPEHSPESDGVI